MTDKERDRINKLIPVLNKALKGAENAIKDAQLTCVIALNELTRPLTSDEQKELEAIAEGKLKL